MVMECNPLLIGGWGNLFGKQYKQQNRIYSSGNIAMALTTVCLPYYLIKKENKNVSRYANSINSK